MRSLRSIAYFAALPMLLIGTPAMAADPSSVELLKEITTLSREIVDNSERDRLLVYVAQAQARTGDIESARRTADSIDNPRARTEAYGQVADALATAGDIDAARALLLVPELDGKADIYVALVRGLARKGDFAQATATLEKITPARSQVYARQQIALAQAAAGDLKAVQATISAIDGRPEDSASTCVDAEILFLKAAKKAEAQSLLAKAKEIAAQAGADSYRAAPYVAAGEWALGDHAAAMKIADALPAPDRSRVLSNMARAQIDLGDLASPVTAADQLLGPEDKIFLYSDLAPALSANDKQSAALLLAKTATNLFPTVQEPYLQTLACTCLGSLKAHVESPAAAVNWARSLSTARLRAFALLGAVGGLPNYRNPNAR